MKKLLLILLVLLIGCSSNNNAVDLSDYKEYYQAIDNNSFFRDSSSNFSIGFEYTMVEDGTYRYYIIIDNPSFAMYDCAVLIRENGITYENQDKMMPSSGILDTKYSLLPNQVDTANGYPKGIILGGEIEDIPFSLDVMIEWWDSSHSSSNREFLHIESY